MKNIPTYITTEKFITIHKHTLTLPMCVFLNCHFTDTHTHTHTHTHTNILIHVNKIRFGNFVTTEIIKYPSNTELKCQSILTFACEFTASSPTSDAKKLWLFLLNNQSISAIATDRAISMISNQTSSTRYVR